MASTEALHLGGGYIWQIWSAEGPRDVLTRVERRIRASEGGHLEDVDVASGTDGRLRIAFRAARRPATQGIVLEQVLVDLAGADAVVRLRIDCGRMLVTAQGPDGDALLRIYEGTKAALASRLAFRLVRLGDSRSMLGAMTDERGTRQDEAVILSVALARGYYDDPKRCGVRELGDELGYSKSVMARKLRAVERHALERYAAAHRAGTVAEPLHVADPPGPEPPLPVRVPLPERFQVALRPGDVEDMGDKPGSAPGEGSIES
ncbi:MAG: helix-turn-helix domain-containing protein [Thermoplasmatota archaeon]